MGVRVEEERVQAVHCKEVAMLMQTLSEPLNKYSIIQNHDDLRLLAIVHESLVSSKCTASMCVCSQ